MGSSRYHRYYKQPDLSLSVLSDVLLSCIEAGTSWSTPNLHHGQSGVCIWVSAPVMVVALSLYTVPGLLGYMSLLRPDLMRHFPFSTTNQRVYGQDYTPSLQLEQLSLSHH